MTYADHHPSQPLQWTALESALAPAACSFLDLVGRQAPGYTRALYLVGGCLRDLLLGLPVMDLDLVGEGDAMALAQATASQLSARVVTHKAFGTATVEYQAQRYDIATARQEVYERPGALPRVSPGTIDADLARRDFTINAMAYALTGPSQGELLDPHGARRDLKDRLVRVLHPASFVDDPTRLFRAVRYEQRLGFRIEERTLSLFTTAVTQGALDTVSGDRIHHELALMLAEAQSSRALKRCGQLGLLDAINPGLGQATQVCHVASEAQGEALVMLAALAYPLSGPQGEALIARLNMPGTWARVVRDAIALRQAEDKLSQPGSKPSQVVQTLERMCPPAIKAAEILAPKGLIKERLAQYRTRWTRIRPRLKGQDLIALGIPSGPMLGMVLAELRRARLDGDVVTRQDELDLARRLLQG